MMQEAPPLLVLRRDVNNTVDEEPDVQISSRLLGVDKQKPFELSLCLFHLISNKVTESIHTQMAHTFVGDGEIIV